MPLFLATPAPWFSSKEIIVILLSLNEFIIFSVESVELSSIIINSKFEYVCFNTDSIASEIYF